MNLKVTIRRALISVSDKQGVVEFAGVLLREGIELLSTGGTARLLRDAGLDVTDVSSVTGFPEIMGGRVKTLHPSIHGGILARRGTDESVMSEHGIKPIDLVVVNLYPFAKTVAKPDCSIVDAIENIDIGGPAMVRAAAKNHQSVAVVTDPSDYDTVIREIESGNGVSLQSRCSLALKAFSHTAAYDGMVSNYLAGLANENGFSLKNSVESGRQDQDSLPSSLTLQYHKVQELRYGENPHQSAAFYSDVLAPGETPAESSAPALIANARSIQGKELSFNNIADADAALECVKQFDEPACVIVKHANPCGVAIAEDSCDAYQLARACDPVSAFGGILAFNRPLNGNCIKTILDQQFVEVLLAPGFDAEALDALKTKPNIRALELSGDMTLDQQYRLQSVGGGVLVQSADAGLILQSNVVTDTKPSADEMLDLMFAWQVAKFVKSNAIVYARDQRTIGIGAGQMSRVYSARIAAIKAADESLRVEGSVMASDAFFPFRDGIDSAAEVGIKAVIQPGGSKNDQEVIDAANEHGVAMVFTGMRHFRH